MMPGGVVGRVRVAVGTEQAGGQGPEMPDVLHCRGLIFFFFTTMNCHMSPFWGNVSLDIHVGKNLLFEPSPNSGYMQMQSIL